jgi:hypothetical protein
MASDEDYAAFLEKANADPSAGVTKTAASGSGGKIQLKTVDHGLDVPRELKVATEKEEWIYISDADEPFVAVSLRLEGSRLPDEGSCKVEILCTVKAMLIIHVETFAKLINHPHPTEAEIEILDVVQWDKKGMYKEVVDATRKACHGGDVRVYRVSLGGSRVEYWVVGVDGSTKGKQEGKLVGVKALAIES